MSYVVEVAIGIDDKAATATRGWFRIDPAGLPRGAAGCADRRSYPLECARARRLRRLADPAERQRHAVHRAGAISSSRPPASAAATRRPQPSRKSPRQRPTTAIWSAYLAEDSEYDDEQARLAGIQRLLVIAGYDAAPIDGVDGPKTQSALERVPEEPRAHRRHRAVAKFLHHHGRGRAKALLFGADLVQRHAAQDHGRGRHRRRQGR
jgi:hypothetical protein